MKLTAVAVLSFAQSIALGAPSVPVLYDDVELQWTVQAFPTGPFIHLNGTIEQVHAQILKINPSFDKAYPPMYLPDTEEVNFEGKRTECGRPLGFADKRYIVKGIDYLRRLPFEVPKLPPGSCGRVSCSWDSAIKWCNHNRHVQHLKSMKTLADGAEHLVANCNKYPFVPIETSARINAPHGTMVDRVSGQVWHEGGWSVIVGVEHC
ncbi:hypothetical protein QBC41DRAFT_385614 [Cercophora samala]|uniref:Uncharacterized protein n=1 Tax=Cercophora samala TaxID=330535 RepID=A0AA40DDZ6_9PEZI|nr:hypothetical protein QBC41DRAFT_385614 [Cercophora samala]